MVAFGKPGKAAFSPTRARESGKLNTWPLQPSPDRGGKGRAGVKSSMKQEYKNHWTDQHTEREGKMLVLPGRWESCSDSVQVGLEIGKMGLLCLKFCRRALDHSSS